MLSSLDALDWNAKAEKLIKYNQEFMLNTITNAVSQIIREQAYLNHHEAKASLTAIAGSFAEELNVDIYTSDFIHLLLTVIQGKGFRAEYVPDKKMFHITW